MANKVSITAEGKKALENELKELISRRPEIAEKIATARANGDLSENEDYTAARNKQKVVEGRILEIQDILLHSKVIRSGKKDKVDLGSTVKVKLGEKEVEYMLVGAVEANPLEKKISNESPIGKALLGKKIGESGQLPNGKQFEILAIA